VAAGSHPTTDPSQQQPPPLRASAAEMPLAIVETASSLLEFQISGFERTGSNPLIAPPSPLTEAAESLRNLAGRTLRMFASPTSTPSPELESQKQRQRRQAVRMEEEHRTGQSDFGKDAGLLAGAGWSESGLEGLNQFNGNSCAVELVRGVVGS
jgi:hypothetical protein